MLSGRKKSQLTPWLWGLTVAASRNRSSWSGAWAGEWKELCSGPSSRRQSLCSPRPSPGSTPAHAQLLSRVPLCVIPWTVARLAPLSIGFLRQEYWSGLPFPSPGSVPDPRIEPASPAVVGRFFTTETPGKLWCFCVSYRTLILLFYHPALKSHGPGELVGLSQGGNIIP